MVFERFSAEYAPRRDEVAGAAPWLPERLVAVDGCVRFAEEFAGASFAAGLYRVHDEQTGPGAQALIREAFPELADRICPFGYDWLGRQFAVDAGRCTDGEPLVLLSMQRWLSSSSTTGPGSTRTRCLYVVTRASATKCRSSWAAKT
ncbi:hypothetical protein [Kribbella sp. NPDC055071]